MDLFRNIVKTNVIIFSALFGTFVNADSAVFTADLSGSGEVRVLGQATWDSAHDRAQGFQVFTGPANGYIDVYAQFSESSGFGISRGYLTFDTSAIPDEAVVKSATLIIWPVDKFTGEHDQYSYLQPIGPSTQSSSVSLSVDDYDDAGSVFNPTAWSDTKNFFYSPWNRINPATFSFNEYGLNGISLDSYTMLALRLGHDIENVAPDDDTHSSSGNRWQFYSPTWFNANLWPKLEVEYYIPSNTTPTLAPIGAQSVNEGNTLQFTVSATDPDNDTLTYSTSGLPSGATFNAETQTFSWTPGYTDAGTYNVTFTVTDDGKPIASTSEAVSITVENTNRAPALSPIGNQTVVEGDTLQFTISATDPDGDALTYTATNLPSGATFNPTTQTFTWNTGYNDAGNYPDIEFTVMDNGSPMELAVELITVTVGNVNRAPDITNPGPQEVLEDTLLTFSLSATDPDGDTTVLTATNLPTGASFNGTTFTWAPSLSQEGVYTVTFTATDNGTPNESTTLDVVITVGDNPTPVEQAEDLVETVVSLDLPQNVENSYLANLQKVAEFIESGKIQAALNQLQAFINKVNQDYAHGTLTTEEHDMLIEMAEGLMEDLSI